MRNSGQLRRQGVVDRRAVADVDQGGGDADGAVSDVCHDLLQPAATIMALTELARIDPEGPDLDRRLDQIKQEVDRLTDICTDVLGRSERVDVDLDYLLGPLVDNEGTNFQGLMVTDFLPAETRVAPASVERAVLNLLSNAMRAAGEEGVIRVATWTDGDDAVVEVSDSGPGFQAGAPGGRRGLGIVRSIMRRHAGSVQVGTGPLGGASVQLRFLATQR